MCSLSVYRIEGGFSFAFCTFFQLSYEAWSRALWFSTRSYESDSLGEIHPLSLPSFSSPCSPVVHLFSYQTLISNVIYGSLFHLSGILNHLIIQWNTHLYFISPYTAKGHSFCQRYLKPQISRPRVPVLSPQKKRLNPRTDDDSTHPWR